MLQTIGNLSSSIYTISDTQQNEQQALKGTSDTKDISGSWSWSPVYPRFTHQEFASRWVDNLKSVAICCSSDMAIGSFYFFGENINKCILFYFQEVNTQIYKIPNYNYIYKRTIIFAI